LIAFFPASEQLFQLRGMIELKLQNFRNAADFFSKGLSVEPNSAALCDVLGTALSNGAAG